MFISYYRVSTGKQQRSGLGLEAQRDAVRSFIGHTPDLEFTEVESGKRDDNRPELQRALNHAELTGATLIVAKLDRLSRDAEFLNRLAKSSVKIVFADMPQADGFMIGIMAQIAQWEREQISKRTKAALAVARAKGRALGGYRGNLDGMALRGAQASAKSRSKTMRTRAAKVMPYIADAQASGHTTTRQIAAYLNQRGIQTPRGKAWQSASVTRLMASA